MLGYKNRIILKRFYYIKDIYIFFNIVNNYKCIRVFKLLVYLGTSAYTATLPKVLYTYNLLLIRITSYFVAAAFYRVSVEFPFKLL